MWVRTGVCKVLVGKRKRKRQLGRARFKRDFNIKRGIVEIFWRAWTVLIWMRDNSICEIHLTYIRTILSDL
jgi:hypothetical protein